MVVGVLRLGLVIPAARSLKEKRHALRRIVDRVRARYNVSIAEVGENDIWQRAVLGVTVVANDHSFVNEVLDKVVRDVEMLGVADLVSREMEIETYSEMHERAHKPMLDGPPAASSRDGQEAPEGRSMGSEEREEAEALAEYLREEDLP
jgi:uncharacterized protein YlxP (DUF503 family)